MRKLIFGMILVLPFTACSNDKKQEKAAQMGVLDVHEKVMADDEKAMISKMKLDTLIEQAKVAKTDTTTLNTFRLKLAAADDAMGDWMSKFMPDYTGKGHDDVMKYFSDQQAKVKQVDLMLTDATAKAAEYIDSVKKK